jgi:hypothetical protein
MLLVVFGCFSAYRKISARQRKLMTAGGVGMRLDVDECDEGWVVLEVCGQSFLHKSARFHREQAHGAVQHQLPLL